MRQEQTSAELPKWAQATLAVLFVLFIGVVVFIPIAAMRLEGHTEGYRKAMQEAIEHGYAEYDSKTGQLRWKVQK